MLPNDPNELNLRGFKFYLDVPVNGIMIGWDESMMFIVARP